MKKLLVKDIPRHESWVDVSVNLKMLVLQIHATTISVFAKERERENECVLCG